MERCRAKLAIAEDAHDAALGYDNRQDTELFRDSRGTGPSRGARGHCQSQGAIVNMVERDSPAEKAGLEAGDVIVEYGGKPVADGSALTDLVVSTRAG
jgi:S1-C subfamily serine protease